jgi:hypothetical protein
MLFSATVPQWVRKLVKQHLKDPVDIDLVGEGGAGKMAETITALAVQVRAPLGTEAAAQGCSGGHGRAVHWFLCTPVPACTPALLVGVPLQPPAALGPRVRPRSAVALPQLPTSRACRAICPRRCRKRRAARCSWTC